MYLRCKSKLGFQKTILPRIPYSWIDSPLPPQKWKVGKNLACPLPPEKWNLARTWHFEFWLHKNTLLPPKLKFVQDLALWVLTTQEYTPHLKIEIWPGLGTLSFDYPRIPPSPSENWNLARTWTLSFNYTRIPSSPQNWNLFRTWHFEFWLPKNTPPTWKLKFGQDLALWVLTSQEYSPPPQLTFECVETNHCIPQGYHLVLLFFLPTEKLHDFWWKFYS